MFDHFLWEILICPVLIALAIRLLADRLRPETAVAFLVTSLAATAAAVLLTLGVFALKAVAELPVTGALLGLSDAYVRADTAAEPWASWLSLVLLAAAVTGIVHVVRIHRRDTAYARRFTALTATDGVVTVDDDRAEAFAVPGSPGRIVVTTGMRAALDDHRFAALLAHERAHLHARHHLMVLLVHLSAAVHPAFRLLVRQFDHLVERAADERAATEIADRRTVAHAVGTAALVSEYTHRAGRLRVAPSRTDLSRAGTVPRRVASLLTPRRPAPRPLLAIPAAIATFALVWTAECVIDLGELLAAAS
ncbi:M56 family metallopeptidase [Actinoplanes utahensis]|uniref:Peptidase M48 domain-containing protein n=1 Tax=Actinoplanes utahensis TaxID=1869 RepID=A0A0A6UMZ7_ACTUT|nr:M56 family metallopeptidase [Actinoplanes utahensis]KHD77505.1 hypothetical protein MB27_10340 [Actinoplanes utahensis]GIF32655.1 peptidase M48 [Actinoplanes utahensis]